MDFKDYYATLGVSKSASEKEIKQAFRRLARKLHPDVNPGDKAAEARFKDVNEAYEVLGNPETRKKYDELGSNWQQYEQAQARGGPNPFARRARWRGGGFRTMTQEEVEEMFGASRTRSRTSSPPSSAVPAAAARRTAAAPRPAATSSTRSS